MIAYLKGKIILIQADFVILDVNNVGHKVFISRNSLLQEKQAVEFFIHEHIREDSNDLFGFQTFKELTLFEKLISVNGIGPKVGLNIISSSDEQKISNAIAQENMSFFQSIPGIGKKVAAKIILELKSKMSENYIFSGNKDDDFVSEALISLGYKNNEIYNILSQIPTDFSTPEEKIKWCLKNLAK